MASFWWDMSQEPSAQMREVFHEGKIAGIANLDDILILEISAPNIFGKNGT